MTIDGKVDELAINNCLSSMWVLCEASLRMSLRFQYDLAVSTRPCMGDDGPALCPTLRALVLARPEARERVRHYIQEVVEAQYPRKKALAALCEVIEILEPSARAGVTVIDGQRTCIETAVFPRCGENFSKSIEVSPQLARLSSAPAQQQ